MPVINEKILSHDTTASPTESLALAQVRLKKGGSPKAFLLKEISFYNQDPTENIDPNNMLTPDGSGKIIIQNSNGQTHTVTITVARGPGADGMMAPPYESGYAANGFPPWTENWRSPGGVLLGDNQCIWIAFTLNENDKNKTFLRDADSTFYVKVTTIIQSTLTISKYGKLTISTLGEITFTWI